MSKQTAMKLCVVVFVIAALLGGCEPKESAQAMQKLAEGIASAAAETKTPAETPIPTAAPTAEAEISAAGFELACYARLADDPGKDGGGQTSFDPYAPDGIVKAGSLVQLVQQPDDGFVFEKWQVYKQTADGQWELALESSEDSITITVDANTSVDALFRSG
jgi:hypothetical protein